MYSDQNDTGMIPEEIAFENIASFATDKMSWQLKSSNYSGNFSASAVFRLSHYDGLPVEPSSNVEITVS